MLLLRPTPPLNPRQAPPLTQSNLGVADALLSSFEDSGYAGDGCDAAMVFSENRITPLSESALVYDPQLSFAVIESSTSGSLEPLGSISMASSITIASSPTSSAVVASGANRAVFGLDQCLDRVVSYFCRITTPACKLHMFRFIVTVNRFYRLYRYFTSADVLHRSNDLVKIDFRVYSIVNMT